MRYGGKVLEWTARAQDSTKRTKYPRARRLRNAVQCELGHGSYSTLLISEQNLTEVTPISTYVTFCKYSQHATVSEQLA